MKNRFHANNFNKDLFFLLTLLVLIIIIPTILLIWFMKKTVDNEKQLLKQKTIELYKSQFDKLYSEIDSYWLKKINTLKKINNAKYNSIIFNSILKEDISSSAIIINKNKLINYPIMISSFRSHIEIQNENLRNMYNFIKNKNINKAIDLDIDYFQKREDYKQLNSSDYSYLLNLELLMLEVLTTNNNKYELILNNLIKKVDAYNYPEISTSQRLFLMKKLEGIDKNIFFKTENAEQLALETSESSIALLNAYKLIKTNINEVWQIYCPEDYIILLFREDYLIKTIQDTLDQRDILKDTNIKIISPYITKNKKIYDYIDASSYMQGWKIQIDLSTIKNSSFFNNYEIPIYIWVSFLVILGIIIISFLIIFSMLKQNNLTRMKNTFIANITHELKTPLTSIKILVETILNKRYKNINQVFKYLKLIDIENNRLTNLIDNFLSFSRMERNKFAFYFTITDINELILKSINIINDEYIKSGFILETELSNKIPEIEVDSDAITTILLNLYNNAFKYSTENKKIIVRTKIEKNFIVIEVEDNGIGIPQKDINKIFKQFYQIDQRLSRKTGGCGLGLSIVKFIVDGHKGKINVISKINQGSNFIIKLPITDRMEK